MSSELLGSLAPLLDEARAGHQEWLIRSFGGMLPAVPAARRRLSRRDTEAGMQDLVEGVLLVHGRRQVRRRASRDAGGEA